MFFQQNSAKPFIRYQPIAIAYASPPYLYDASNLILFG